jgi:hypothetical protein
MRFRFMKKKTPNLQRPMSNARCFELNVERWAPAREALRS